MSNNLVQNLTQKFNQQQRVTNETKSSVTTNIQTKKSTKTSTSINSVGTATKIATSNDEFIRNFKKIETSFGVANTKNKIVVQTSSDSGDTKIKSFEKPVLPTRNDFQQNGKTTRVVKAGNNNNIITEITKSPKSMDKPVVPKREVSNFTKSTSSEKIISCQKPVVQKNIILPHIINTDTNDVQTNKLPSVVKPVVPKKNVLHKLKSDEHSSQIKAIQVSTGSRKPVVPKKEFPRNDVIGKQIDTVQIKNVETSDHDNIHKQLIPSEIIRQMNARLNENKENSTNNTPEEDKNLKVDISDIKTIDAVENQVENIQRMLDMQMNQEIQMVSEEIREDVVEELKETIQENRTGTIMNNRYLHGQLRSTVEESLNKEPNINEAFTVNALEETKEVIKEESMEKIEENLVSNVTNNTPAYLAMSGPIRSKVQEEISNEELEERVVKVDVLRSAVVDNEDLTSRAVDNYMTLNNYDYVNEEIKVSTVAAYNDDGTYEPVNIANGAAVRGKLEEDTNINEDVLRHISELRFDQAKSSRDTFLSLQSNETITESCDMEEEQWLDAFQHNLASVPNITPEAISQNTQLMKILQKYDKTTASWRKIMEYMQLNIINTLTPEKIDAQEAKLHLIRKELIYLDALNVFNNHFISKLVLFISQNEIKILFGNVKEVIECSQKLLKDIEDCWTENVLMPNFAEVLCKNVQTTFKIYISYCENQMNFEKRLENIISDRKRQFKEILDEIQKDPVCRGLHLHAYMLLPIQKIQRFPSLIQNILQFLTPIDEEYHQFHNLLDHVNHLLKKCTKAVKDKEIWAKTLEFMNQLEFPKDVSADELGVNETRQIIRSGEVEMLEITNSLFGRKINRKPVHLFLFNDLLVIARKNSKDKYSVVQFSLRIYVEIETDSLAMMQYYEFMDSNDCFLLKIDERIPKEILIICKSASDKIRWHHALDPEDPHMRNQYELDGYFQVIGEYNYKSCQSDEISFHTRDVIHVYRNIENSWYFGKNIKTGDVGWFPAKYVYCRDQN
ncbi:Ephexin [Carabus blaptoides fortunei]